MRIPFLAGIIAGVIPALACVPISGADQLWSKPSLRYLIVGEMHGSAEVPAIFGDLVCAALETKRPVIAAIERPAGEQPAIDAFLKPEDHEAAVKRLVALPGWQDGDGRTSVAMLSLLESLRSLHVEVVAFDARPGGSDAERNSAMASAVKSAAARRSDALVIVLTGNLHGSKKPIRGLGDYPFMAMLLPEQETTALLAVDMGGEIWADMDGVRGAHKLKSTGGTARGVDLTAGRAPIAGYDGVLSTGLPCTASPPVASKP